MAVDAANQSAELESICAAHEIPIWATHVRTVDSADESAIANAE